MYCSKMRTIMYDKFVTIARNILQTNVQRSENFIQELLSSFLYLSFFGHGERCNEAVLYIVILSKLFYFAENIPRSSYR